MIPHLTSQVLGLDLLVLLSPDNQSLKNYNVLIPLWTTLWKTSFHIES